MFLLAVPIAVYVASYVGRLDATILTTPDSFDWWPRAFARRQLEMLQFHADLHGDHVSTSPAWSWLLLKRPVAFYFEISGGRYREILALGNPVVLVARHRGGGIRRLSAGSPTASDRARARHRRPRCGDVSALAGAGGRS